MNYKMYIWNIIKYFSNLTVSIILLLLIAMLSVIGTIIEQDHTLEYYKNKYPVHTDKLIELNWHTIQALKLDQMYTNIWFLALLLLFAMSLIVCTFSTQLPSLKNARRWKFKKNIAGNQELHDQQYNCFNTPSNIIYHLNSIDYYIFYKNNYIYAYKGLHGRLAPIFVHIGLILLLAGSCISLFTSFSLQAMIPIGETFNLQNIVKAGIFSKIPSYIRGEVNDFRIEYYEDQSIKQFYSLVTMANPKKNTEIKHLLSVNHPLYFEGLTIYQTDWQLNGLSIEIDHSKTIQVPLTKFINNNNTYWIATFNYDKNTIFSLLLSNLKSPIMCYDKDGNLINQIKLSEYQNVQHIPLEIKNILSSTGLQIKEDPGVNIIYFSFAILMLATVNSYTSYSQIWIVVENNRIKVSGITNRAEIKFEEDLFTLRKFLLTQTLSNNI